MPSKWGGLARSMGRLFRTGQSVKNPGRALRSRRSPSSIQIQFMHGRYDEVYATGYHGKKIPPELEGMPLDARQHDAAQRRMMEGHADEVFQSMRVFLNGAAISRTAKPTGGNTIVHVTTPEFCFYHHTSMYDQDIFEQRVLEPLSDLMRRLPPWLTFHLGTMPVQFTNREIHGEAVGDDSFGNCAIYGQCGPKTEGAQFYAKKYHTIPKDILNAEGSQVYVPGDPHVDSGLMPVTNDPFPRAFVVRTQAGNECTVLLQICLDHQYRVGKDVFERSPDLPQLGWQDILASSTPYNSERSLFTLVSHTDPKWDKVAESRQEEWLLGQRQVLAKVPYHNAPLPNRRLWIPGMRLRVYEPTSPGELCEHARLAERPQPIPGSADQKGPDHDDDQEGGGLSR